MQVPSGQIFTQEDVELVRLLHIYKVVDWHEEPVTFQSGICSHLYTSFRDELTDYPSFEWLLGRKIANMVVANTLPEDNQPCLIGIPAGGTALAQAAAMVSVHEKILAATKKGDIPICHRVMREQTKAHGVHRSWVNGDPDVTRHTYWFVDNVVTDGKSKLDARDRLHESEYPAYSMPSLIVVDLQRGGVQNMKMRGFPRIVVGYQILDICFVLTKLGLWPAERFVALDYEISTGVTI